jgi:hypothetical protein
MEDMNDKRNSELKNPSVVIPPERDKSSNDPAWAGEEKS